MKRFTSFVLWILSLYLVLILLLSIIVTQEKAYRFLLNSNFDESSDITIIKSNWHPFKPSIVFEEIQIIDPKQKIIAKNTEIEYSLFNILNGNFFSKINVSELSIYSNNYNQTESFNFLVLIDYLRQIEVINLKTIQIFRTSDEIALNGSLYSLNDKDGTSFELNLLDSKSDNLVLRFQTQEDMGSNFIKGQMHSSNFLINENLFKNLCEVCKTSINVSTNLNFTFIQNKPLVFKGNLDIVFNKDIFGMDHISSSFMLKDSQEFFLQVGSFLNQDKDIRIPNFVINFNSKDPILFFPKVDLSNTKLIKLLTNNLDLGMNFKGVLRNSHIKFNSDDNFLRSSLENVEINSSDFNIKGLTGSLKLDTDLSVLSISSPLLSISSNNFLDKEVIFNDFNSLIDFNFSSRGLDIYPSTFSSILYGEELNGFIRLESVPTKNYGDLTLRIRTDNMLNTSAFLLFPNTPYLKTTKYALNNLLGCGFIKGANLIYRGPIDRQYRHSSATFGLTGFADDMCIDVNGYKILAVKGNFKVNDFNFEGNIKEGDFLGSNVEADVKTFRNNLKYFFQAKGRSEGPFSSILDSFIQTDSYFSNIQGSHETEFSFRSPLNQNISLLSPLSNLQISSEINKGGIKINTLGYNLENLFSSISYDSSSGFKEGYASFKLNSIPFSFGIDETLRSSEYTIFTSKEIVKFEKFVPKFLQNKFVGSSEILLKIGLPSFKKGSRFKKPYINLTSKLTGTEVALPAPFFKSINDEIKLDIDYYPTHTDSFSRLKFKYGDLFRGKVDFSDTKKQGYLIAGADKQSITTEAGVISIIGTIEKMDLALLDLNIQPQAIQSTNFVVKLLEIGEVNYSNFTLPKTNIYSDETQDYFNLNISNKILQGSLSLPKNKGFLPIIDLDFLNLEITSGNNSEALEIFDNLKTSLKFRTNSLILNSINFGNWKFVLKPSNSMIMLDDLVGEYGKWGLTKTDENISSLKIIKKNLRWESSLKSRIYTGSPEKGFVQLGINPNFEMDTLVLDTDIYWNSLPWNLAYKDILGEISLNAQGLLIQDREDLPTPNNLLRLINIFNVTDSFEKVTNLDFRKLYKSGFSADSVVGTLQLNKNSVSISKPLIFRSGSSEFKWEGEIYKDNNGSLSNLDLEVIMTLPLREYLPAYAFLLGGPVTAGIVYIAGKAFERNLDQLSSGAWDVKGTLDKPKTEFKGWFEK
tara:strand:+ start:79 stop:3687 length:3609 start_codon:yes stop_codon:yes gene_type:complete